jgi:signal transduction histidine kinase
MRLSEGTFRVFGVLKWVPLLGAFVAAQGLITLDQAGSRSGHDLIAAHEGRQVTIRAEVTANPVWAIETYYLPVRDSSDHGLLLRANRDQFAGLAPGDWIEVSGIIQSRAAMPQLVPSSIRQIRHDLAPEPKDLSIPELAGLRYLGLLTRTSGVVSSTVGENLGGKSFSVSDRGITIGVFLPRDPSSKADDLPHLRLGDRVRLRGLATQYSLESPHDSGFQLLLTGPRDVELIPSGWNLSPRLVAVIAGAVGVIVIFWWIRARRLGINRRSMRAFHALSEDIISSTSPTEIAEKLVNVLPTVIQATGVRLYLANRRTKSLERVPTKAEPDPMAVSIDAPPDGLASGAAVCYRNRTLLNVPDVRRSPFVKVDTKTNLPRSAMFLPLFSQSDTLGVLEVGNARRLGYFTVEEQAATQHLANQVAAALKLQEQQTIREQLFRSEKLAATGQLISGVASELRAPLDTILQLATAFAAYRGRPIPERDLLLLAAESQRASEMVSRLVSFARPEDSAARHVDINGLITSLMEFRDPEWRTLGLRVQNRLATQPAVILGAQGQIEQVFLNLLVHAEQCAMDAPGKSISVASSQIAGHATVEISYSAKGTADPVVDLFAAGQASESGALGLSVCQGIIQGHGGEIRLRGGSGTARFEIELPLVGRDQPSPHLTTRKTATPLTLLLVDPDHSGERQLLAQLGARGHRVVPAPVEEAADLAQRLRFDAVFWAVRMSTSRANEYRERIRAQVPLFVLVSDGYDADLAHSLESSGGFLLARPVQEADLERVLQSISARTSHVSAPRTGR